jgi:1-acyl-sn-glycerol-3-phosphate acyltransferase
MGTLRAVFIVIAFLAVTLPLMLLQRLLKSQRLPWYYHHIICKILGMTVEIQGTLPKGTLLLVSNHLSWLDIPLLGSLKPLAFIAKQEVATWPLFGAMAKLQGSIFVDRERRSNTDVEKEAIEQRLLAGQTVLLFPEGTTSDGSAVLPFKSSYFGAVTNVNLPVVPISITYLDNVEFYAWYGEMDLAPHLWKVIKAGAIKARVIIHPPLKKANRKEMAQEAEKIIRSSLG